MKKLFALMVVALAGFSGTSAIADTIPLLRHPHSWEMVSWQFNFNEEAGTAIVKLRLEELRCSLPRPTCLPVFRTKRVAVPGLYFDSAAMKVMYTAAAGAKVDCANVSLERGRFGRMYWAIKPTGACRVRETRTAIYFEAN